MRSVHEDEMMRLAMRESPADAELQEPSAASAMAARRQVPIDVAIRKKFWDEIKAQQGFLLRQREANEGTNFVGQSHPIQDAPFTAKDIWFSSQLQTILGGGADGIFTPIQYTTAGDVPKGYVAFIRSIIVETFDALADGDLRVTVRNNGTPVGVVLSPPSALLNFRQNAYFHFMQGQIPQVLVRNLSAINPHDFIVRVHGWMYPVAQQDESPRGVIPHVG